VASRDGHPGDGGFDAAGRALTGELLPAVLDFAGVRFHLAPATLGKPNAVEPRGQAIALPAGNFNRVYVLAASSDGDQKATVAIGDQRVDLNVQDWGGFIGQWDTRLWRDHGPEAPPEYAGLTPGYIKTSPVAWFADHRHSSDGSNEEYAYSYLYAYAIPLPANAKTLTLPSDASRVRILAISVAREPEASPARSLYDIEDRSNVQAGFYERK
jgi:alpha-mannosidase